MGVLVGERVWLGRESGWGESLVGEKVRFGAGSGPAARASCARKAGSSRARGPHQEPVTVTTSPTRRADLGLRDKQVSDELRSRSWALGGDRRRAWHPGGAGPGEPDLGGTDLDQRALSSASLQGGT